PATRRLFDYAAPTAQPHEREVANINAYLLDAPDVLVMPRSTPLADVPPMVFGSMPNDGGNLLLTDEDREALIAECPEAADWIRRCVGSDEYINNIPRYCLWLKDIPPETLREMRPVIRRVDAVREYRLGSKRAATRKLAAIPSLFAEIRQPNADFLLVPKVSSEDRPFIPIGFMSPETIATDLCLLVPNADLHLFGIISSSMHMAWVRNIGGRLESRFRYSATLTYNTFPFPTPSAAQRNRIADKAQTVLDVREHHQPASMATLYNPETMPPDLVAAHRALDRVVDRAYRRQPFAGEPERMRLLLAEYQRLAAPLDAQPQPRRQRRRRSTGRRRRN
ncbi:MAG: type IIL restriction-modification enzyme MmeI, partial [Rhodospirillales bacterium]